MELLESAFLKNNFGLRMKFPWVSKNLRTDAHIQPHIHRKERRYLTKLVAIVFNKDFELNIERIENPYLWGQYVLRYEEMKSYSKSNNVQEHIMIHATSSDKAYKIAENNFNWRLVKRARFGTGISFANNAKYAWNRSTRKGALIIAGVLIANSSPGSWNQKLPTIGDDTTTGYSKDVCIKYYDNDFYPYYIIQE